MKMLEHCIQYLKKSRVLYAHSIEPPCQCARGVPSGERTPAHGLAKTVVYAGDAGLGMAMLPADYNVDLDEVRRLLGLTAIRLATESELAATFPECEFGAIPPFGNLFDLPVLMDENLAVADYLAFTAGTSRDVIHISGVEFHNLVNPLVAPFAVKNELARRS